MTGRLVGYHLSRISETWCNPSVERSHPSWDQNHDIAMIMPWCQCLEGSICVTMIVLLRDPSGHFDTWIGRTKLTLLSKLESVSTQYEAAVTKNGWEGRVWCNVMMQGSKIHISSGLAVQCSDDQHTPSNHYYESLVTPDPDNVTLARELWYQ